jgi:RNA polymerase sigma factor (TIGR02999 family)
MATPHMPEPSREPGDADPAAARNDERRRAETLLPELYDELRRLAHARLSNERPGATLDATGLVHEAYLRLANSPTAASAQRWDNEGHFFAAAATAMRRILVERARSRGRLKRGGGRQRIDLEGLFAAADEQSIDFLALDEAMDRLAAHDQRKHDLVMLRFFAGLSSERAAEALAISPATAERDWTYARAWLFRELDREGAPP